MASVAIKSLSYISFLHGTIVDRVLLAPFKSVGAIFRICQIDRKEHKVVTFGMRKASPCFLRMSLRLFGRRCKKYRLNIKQSDYCYHLKNNKFHISMWLYIWMYMNKSKLIWKMRINFWRKYKSLFVRLFVFVTSHLAINASFADCSITTIATTPPSEHSAYLVRAAQLRRGDECLRVCRVEWELRHPPAGGGETHRPIHSTEQIQTLKRGCNCNANVRFDAVEKTIHCMIEE